MKKFFKIVFNILKYLYITLLVIYLVFICIHRLSIDNSILGYRLFTINNNEMYPKYKVNDIIIVKDYDPNKLKLGDTISYIGDCCGQGGMTVNHKIIKIDKEANKITTKGINSSVEDPEIKYKQVIGKVVGILPVINFLHHILKNQIGFFAVVFLPIMITIIVLIIGTIRDIRKEKKSIEVVDEETKEETIDDNKEIKEDTEVL